MEYIDRFIAKRNVPIIGSAVLLYLYYSQILDSHWPKVVSCTFIISIYLFMIWMPRQLGKSSHYAIAGSIVIAIVVSERYLFHNNIVNLLWPLICILPALPKKYSTMSNLIAVPAILVILILSAQNSFPFSTFFGALGLFVGIRSRQARYDAYRLSQLHLQELNEAHTALQQTHAELQEATVYSMRYAALEERTRLAREIHDGLGHQLTSLIIQLEALKLMIPANLKDASNTTKQLLDLGRKAMAEVRLAVREWVDEEFGLGPVALKGLVSQVQARANVNIPWSQSESFSEWPMETSIVLYRVLQESLTNVMRHAQASIVQVSVTELESNIRLIIEDNGTHTPDTPFSAGFGITGMTERCHQVGGTLNIECVKPHGLRIVIEVPIHPERNDSELIDEVITTTGGKP